MAVVSLASIISTPHLRVNVTSSSKYSESLLLPRTAIFQKFRAPLVERQKSEPFFRGRMSRPSAVRSEGASAAAPVLLAPPSTTEWFQKTIQLPGVKRGCHVVTRQIVTAVPELKNFQIGIAHLFVMHTSASLTINENASSDVPKDMEDSLNRIVPEGSMYRHLDEGYDDMPAHVKSSLMGCSLTIPVSNGRLHLGTWQGIYLNEHRNSGGSRSICVTIQGQKRVDGRKGSPPTTMVVNGDNGNSDGSAGNVAKGKEIS